jgi:hypothetical protein
MPQAGPVLGIKAVPESRNQLLQSKDVFKGAHNGFLDA